jgi:hypothetical protein
LQILQADGSRDKGGEIAMSETNNNLRLWDQLGKTDPAHTKQFQRSGGFKGTAIKPMWCNLRMTEFFGPCGIGWGMEKPAFETHQADKEMLVFCTVGVWYLEKPDSASRGLVYGVGGDKYLISQATGLRASDEAFKAAYTDAIGNAMKFIGVAADVHMGLFDDSKYVQEMRAEFGSGPTETQRAQRPVQTLNPDAEDPNDYDAHMDQRVQERQPTVGAPINPKLTKVLYAIAMGKQWDTKGYRHWINQLGYAKDGDIPAARFEEIKAKLEAA